MPRYAELIYNGFWFSPEREMLQALIDKSQEHVTGTVRLKLYKGMARTVARWSDHTLYSEKHVTFEEDAGAYDQKDAAGFIRLNALRLKLIATRNARVEARISVQGDDGAHFAAEVVDESFRGMNRVQQQRAVYAALKGKMDGSQGELHALALTTRAPD
jgi:stress-induced morphogen